MKVFISADIEGINGVVTDQHAEQSGLDYGKAREWMTLEVNAAVEGALAGGAKQVVIKDAHNTAVNIELDKLHPAAELISGWGMLGSMVEGLEAGYDAVFLIGYHARAMTLGGTLAHTWSRVVLDLTLNGQPIGEAAWAAAYAGHFNVPVALVTGDDKLFAEAEKTLPKGFQSVITKTGMSKYAAKMRPLLLVRDEIRQAAIQAVQAAKSITPFRPTLPATVTIRFRDWERLQYCEAVPNVERLSVDTFRYRAKDMIEAHKYFATLNRLAKL